MHSYYAYVYEWALNICGFEDRQVWDIEYLPLLN